ncbi:hypothetical protein [Microbulbifer yueqingensis]|uniref:Phytase-like domain-containing protein n=1 Tax=Microbulbifer yueqingensis TaxID=658219 RepID=A0A1G8UV74_9GAMM|nr:hypothetical protein [Microbulbifer yueqingensis]SDJ56830.1 hypothetical protein SAMN05216212_0258 [Microbulbifer yueqingensis]
MLKPILLLLGLLLAARAPAQPVLPAELLGSWWLDGSAGLDMSGLAFCEQRLLAVSDKDSGTIYAVDFAGSQPGQGASPRARLQPYQRFGGLDVPRGELGAALLGLVQPGLAADFEGISCSGGAIYLLSERYHRLVRLLPDGSGHWLPQGWAEPARARGYMQRFNGAGEGLVRKDGQTWIALERQARGLVRLGENKMEFYDIPPVPGLDFHGRPEDITGLDIHAGALYTLERNAFAVCRRSLGDLEAEWCIEYRAVEEAPEHVYRKTRYGKAEGLAVNDEGIFIVLDNNNVGRASDPDDRRALLMQLGHPQGTLLQEVPQP